MSGQVFVSIAQFLIAAARGEVSLERDELSDAVFIFSREEAQAIAADDSFRALVGDKRNRILAVLAEAESDGRIRWCNCFLELPPSDVLACSGSGSCVSSRD